MAIRRSLVLIAALLLAQASSAEAPPLVVFLGDSLSAGYGLPAREAFPAVVERKLAERGTPIRVVNAGVSGDTTAGGLSRLPWLLQQKPDLVVVELGGNDGLRGQSPEAIERNLRAIIEKSKSAGAKVILLAMAMPPSYGPYARSFREIYPRVARDLDVPLVEGFLEGVGGVTALNLDDGIHPTAAGHERLAENVLPSLASELD
ncbi:MAG: arylesterase [Candidatus Binatia bacterium]